MSLFGNFLTNKIDYTQNRSIKQVLFSIFSKFFSRVFIPSPLSCILTDSSEFAQLFANTKNKIIPIAFSNLYTFLSCEASVFTPPFFWNSTCRCNSLRQLVASLPRTSVPKAFALPSPLFAFDDPANIQRRVSYLQSVLSICLFDLHFWWTHSFLNIIKQHFFDCNSLQRFLRILEERFVPSPFLVLIIT